MKKNTLSAAIFSSLLGYSALVTPVPQASAATSAEATSSWAVSRVASISQGSYCTMAQKYSNDTILSFARNTKGEYSLALDFQTPVFQGSGEQTLTLQAGSGQKQSFKASPQTPQAVVIGLGPDENFMKSLDSAGALTVSYSGGETNYKIKEFATGRGELAICVSALQRKAATPSADAVAQEVAEKASAASPTSSSEPSIEGLLSARPTPSMGTEPLSSTQMSSTQTSAPVGKVEIVEKVAPAVSSVSDADLRDLKIENAQLKKALTESRQSFENAQAQQNGAIAAELQEKLSAIEDENESLKRQLSSLQSAKSSKPDLKPDPKAEEEKAKLQSDVQRMTQQVETLKAENTTLKNQIALAAAVPAPAPVEVPVQSAEDKARMDAVLAENSTLKAALAASRDAQSRAQQTIVQPSGDDNKLRKQIGDLNIRIETLEGEKKALQSSYETLQKDSENGQLKTVGGNWDLEQATRRYQESQREIRRLGALLEDERLKCSADKKEIEAMLFDPEIAKGSQIAKLNELQSQVSERDAKIKEMEGTVARLQAEPPPQMKAQIDTLKNDVATRDARMKEMESTIARLQTEQTPEVKAQIDTLKNDVATRDARMKNMESTIAKLQTEPTPEVKSQIDALKNDVATRDARMKEMEGTIARLQTEPTPQVKAQIDALKNDVATRDARMKEMESTVARLQAGPSPEVSAQIESLRQAVAERDNRIRSMEAQLSASNAKLAMQTASAAAASNASYNASSQQPAQVPAKAVASPFPSERDYTSFLKTAGVPVKGNLSQISGGDPSSYRAYSWKTDSLYGSVEMRSAASPADFDSVVSQYLSRAKSRCNGDFASVPSTITATGAQKSASYEIACVGQGSSSSASILFTLKNGIVSTVAHEGRAEAMELAIDARDRIARSFR